MTDISKTIESFIVDEILMDKEKTKLEEVPVDKATT